MLEKGESIEGKCRWCQSQWRILRKFRRIWDCVWGDLIHKRPLMRQESLPDSSCSLPTPVWFLWNPGSNQCGAQWYSRSLRRASGSLRKRISTQFSGPSKVHVSRIEGCTFLVVGYNDVIFLSRGDKELKIGTLIVGLDGERLTCGFFETVAKLREASLHPQTRVRFCRSVSRSFLSFRLSLLPLCFPSFGGYELNKWTSFLFVLPVLSFWHWNESGKIYYIHFSWQINVFFLRFAPNNFSSFLTNQRLFSSFASVDLISGQKNVNIDVKLNPPSVEKKEEASKPSSRPGYFPPGNLVRCYRLPSLQWMCPLLSFLQMFSRP